ncbi:PhnD/SsuA/transferrin family substrate-binding protein [Sutterella sp.]|uniref:sensor histidine kinase n=1 Tax=Sutterella sp. TaxID=1981025 RepID=UPI0026E0DF09|nr:PhnD/SsuA/transferrin family substrate-binding protein [Sutterella sp.]
MLGGSGAALAKDVIQLAVVEMTEPGYVRSTVIPVKRTIEHAFPDRTVVIMRVASADLAATVEKLRPDFVISPAANFLQIVDAQGAHPIATRKTRAAKDPSRSAGAAVVALADRADVGPLATLKGLRAAATSPESLDGWVALRYELEKAGFNSGTFFRELKFMGFGMPNVISAVLSGSYDVGIVPACMLENLEREGLIEAGALRVVARKPTDETTCAASTDLYPDLVVSALTSAEHEVVRGVTAALLTADMPGDFGWYAVSDFHEVRALEEALHLGPWAYLEDMTPAGLWRRWRPWILGVAAIVLLLLVNEWRLRRLVRRRTAELERALAERDRLEASEAKARERLSKLERMGALSQLCTLVAHELKQPVGAVINYLAVARMKLSGTKVVADPLAEGAAAAEPDDAPPVDPVMLEAIRGADEQARRISAIVDRVRGYARRERAKRVEVDLARVVVEAAAGVRLSNRAPIETNVTAPGKAVVEGDPLELELIVHNLMKNAAEAVRANEKELGSSGERAPAGLVTATLAVTGDEAVISVCDNGPRLSDEAFARLSRVSASVKPDGLGIGLGIVRNLVEENGGRLTLSRLPVRGLSAEVRFDLFDPQSAVKAPETAAASEPGTGATQAARETEEAGKTKGEP